MENEVNIKKIVDKYGNADIIPFNINKMIECMDINIESIEFDQFVTANNSIAECISKYGSLIGMNVRENDKLNFIIDKSLNNVDKRELLANQLVKQIILCSSKDMWFFYKDTITKDNGDKYSLITTEINTLASKMLIQETALDRVLKVLTLPHLSVLANMFDVSPIMMKRRLDELSIQYIDNINHNEKMK